MAITTSSPYGRGQVSVPDLGHEGGASLHTKVTNAFAELSNQQTARWTGEVTLANSATENVVHNFGMTLSNLHVRIYESGAPISMEDQEANYLISQVDTDTISITNTSGGSKTFYAYVWGFDVRRLLGRWDGRVTATTALATGCLDIFLPQNESAMIRYMISARKDGTTANSYELLVQAENNAGTITVTEMRRTELEEVTSMDVGAIGAGNEVRLQVTGDGTNIDWFAVGEITYF